MNTQFYILLSLFAVTGFENYGQVYLGNDGDVANELFSNFQGSRDLLDTTLLHIDLMETVNNTPVKITTLCCTLDEFGYNMKLIAREVFKQKNLEF